MKTTPDEVKYMVAKKHGYEHWVDLIFSLELDEFLKDGKFRKIENDAMCEYAEIIFNEKLQSFSNKLPTAAQWKEWYTKENIEQSNSPHYETFNWMKQAASVVIAKEREELNHYKKEYVIIRQLLNAAELTIEQKDKEIESYKEVLEDQRLLVIELDILINGEKGAAKQASLCDVVSQIKTMILSKII